VRRRAGCDAERPGRRADRGDGTRRGRSQTAAGDPKREREEPPLAPWMNLARTTTSRELETAASNTPAAGIMRVISNRRSLSSSRAPGGACSSWGSTPSGARNGSDPAEQLRKRPRRREHRPVARGELVKLPVVCGEDRRARIVLLDQLAQRRDAHAPFGAEDRDAANALVSIAQQAQARGEGRVWVRRGARGDQPQMLVRQAAGAPIRPRSERLLIRDRPLPAVSARVRLLALAFTLLGCLNVADRHPAR